MPFDASGNFSRLYSWESDRDGGVRILASRMDAEFDNFAGGMNQIFFRNGLVPMSGNLGMGQNSITGVAAGSVGAPSYRFADDPNTGVFLNGLGNYCVVTGGSARLNVNNTGVQVTGNATAENYYINGTAGSTGLFGSTAVVYYGPSGSPVANTLLLVTGNVERVRVDNGQMTFNVPLTLNAAPLGLSQGGTGGRTPTEARIGLGFGTACLNNTGDFQAALGYTPVQMGTGVGQLGNIIKIGWDGIRLKATVDATDQGNIVFDNNIVGVYAPLAGANFTGALSAGGSITGPNFFIGALAGATGINANTRHEYYQNDRIDAYAGASLAYSANSAGTVTATNFTMTSDERLKTDIQPLTGSLEAIEAMRGVAYTRLSTGDREIGLIAQELFKVRPQYVYESGAGGMLSVAYGNIVADLIEAVKELSLRIRTLETRTRHI